MFDRAEFDAIVDRMNTEECFRLLSAAEFDRAMDRRNECNLWQHVAQAEACISEGMTVECPSCDGTGAPADAPWRECDMCEGRGGLRHAASAEVTRAMRRHIRICEAKAADGSLDELIVRYFLGHGVLRD